MQINRLQGSRLLEVKQYEPAASRGPAILNEISALISGIAAECSPSSQMSFVLECPPLRLWCNSKEILRREFVAQEMELTQHLLT